MDYSISKAVGILNSMKNKKNKWLNEGNLDRYEKKLDGYKSKSSQMMSELKVANKIANFIFTKDNEKLEDTPINYVEKSEQTSPMEWLKQLKANVNNMTSDIDGGIGITKKISKFVQKSFRKSSRFSNFIRNKLVAGGGNLVQDMVNNIGRIGRKDLKKYGGALKQLAKAGIEKTLLGSTSPEQVKALSKNRIAKKILDTVGPKRISSMYNKVKNKIEKGFNWSLDDTTSLINQGIERIKNPKATRVIEGAKNLKISGVMRKAASTKIGQAFMKSFSIGNAMNVHSIMTEESDFKKLVAGVDIAGDFIGNLPGPVAKAIKLGTSTLNFVGGLTYDVLDSKLMEGFGGKKAVEFLDGGAGLIVKPVGSAIKTVNTITKSLNDKVSKTYIKAKDKISNAFKESVDARARGTGTTHNNSPYQTLIRNVIVPQTRPYSNLINLYHSKYNGIKNSDTSSGYSRSMLDGKLLGDKKYNSNKNNFTININSSSLSIDEVANQLASKIQLTMENMYA